MTWLDSGSDAAAGTAGPRKRALNNLRTGSRRPRDGRTATPRAPQPYPQQQQQYGACGRRPAVVPGNGGTAHDDEPEYFGDGGGTAAPTRGSPDPYAANNPGHTQAFSVGEDPYNQGGTYRAGSAPAPRRAPACTGRNC